MIGTLALIGVSIVWNHPATPTAVRTTKTTTTATAAAAYAERNRRGCDGHDDEKHDGDEALRILSGVGEGLVQDHVAGQVKRKVRMRRPGLVEQPSEKTRDFSPRGLLGLRQDEVDDQRGHMSVPGNQLSDQFWLVQGDCPDPVEGRRRSRTPRLRPGVRS